MSLITVDTSLCAKDGICVAVCGSRSLTTGPQGFPVEVPNRFCITCGHCVAACPTGALTHHRLPQEVMLPAAEFPPAETIDRFLMSRRSVREFKDQPVSNEVLAALLDIARRAPTASNSQKLQWIVVSDAARVRALAAETVVWVRNTNGFPLVPELWDSGYDFPLRGAPAVVLACAPEDYQLGREDCAIACTFLELAAEARGLGACWAGLFSRAATLHPPLRQALSLPDGMAVRGGLMLGYPKYRYRRIPPRKPLTVQWL
jgi:nitroreductase/NAD-dependent dihydropyrimidine dehydrogenase PreA subunit